MDKDEKELNYVRHHSIKSITEDIDKMQFNTSIARLMEFTNALSKYLGNDTFKNASFLKESIIDFIILLAPFAPHFAEEQWELIGINSSVFNEKWPEFNPKALIKDVVEIAIQLNGKIRAKINISTSSSEDEIKEAALNNEDIKNSIGDKEIKKVIVIKNRLVNIVAK